MRQNASNFDALEKQLAKDALEKALKDLHGEITREIEKNKRTFSDEIKKSLANLNETLEKHISDEIDRKLPIILAKNFSNISEQVKSSFNEMFLPVVNKAELNMDQLKSQGDKTLQSWGNMMKQYERLWNTPFFLVVFVSILAGSTISLFSSYYLTREDRISRQRYEDLLHWYAAGYFKLKGPETITPPTQPKVINQPKKGSQTQAKKNPK